MTWRNVLGMLILVGLSALAFMWMQGDGTPTAVGPSTLLGDFVKSDVTGIKASSPEGSAELRRRPDDSELWDVRVGQEWARADGIHVDEILGALARCEVRTSWPAAEVSAADLSTYGLTDPPTVVELEVPGEPLTVRFGRSSPAGQNTSADRGAGTTVMVASSTAATELTNALRDGLRDKRITDLRTYDVKRVEISKGGVTTLQAEKDIAQIWRVLQPFKGYADPTIFETRVSNIVNEQWLGVVEDGAQDLAKYGLVKPAAEVTLTSKRGVARTIVLGTGEDMSGGRYVIEQGYHSVYLVSKRFADAVLADALEIRDRSFTRLGFGIDAVTVNVAGTSWVLRKAASDWEVEKPGREPAEEEVVMGFLEQLRQWPVLEFRDAEDPADYGISPEGDQVEIETEGGALTTLLIGMETSDGNRYAQRKEDGALVVVLGGPVKRMLAGWLQFKRRSAIELPIDDLEFIGREGGFAEDAAAVTDEKWRRDLGDQDKSWKPEIGQVGAGLDSAAMNELLLGIRSIHALEWEHYDAEHADEMGFDPRGGKAATAWFELGFRSVPDRWLEIGNKVEGRDAYFARERGSHFAFQVAADVVKRLTAPLMKAE